MIVEFEEKNHVYSVNGNIASSSVTELLKKHGLAPRYDKAKLESVKKAADIGKKVHKDLENVLNTANYEPKTSQGIAFKKWVEENLDCGVGEQMLGYDNGQGLILAGTADVMGILKNGKLLVADHKNTSAFHREYVSWQVSLLDYFARKLGNEKINGKKLCWKGASSFLCFHYDPKKGDLSIKKLDKIPDSEIERLLECEARDEKYQRRELVVDPDLQKRFISAEEYLISVQKELKRASDVSKKIREEMVALFENQGIKSWRSPNGLNVIYVAPSERLIIDSAKLKKQFPQAFCECQKLSKVKSSIRITTEEDDEAF